MKRKHDIDLVLVNPGSRHRIYQSLGDELTAVETPIWAGLMATYVRNKGYSVQLIDAEAENLTPREVSKRVIEMNPALTAMVIYGHQPSASTQSMPGASAACTELKQEAPDLPIIMVGGHPASLPEQTLREEDADFVCGGEGLITLVELIEAIKSSPHPEFNQVHDLWYWSDGKVHSTAPTPLIRTVNEDMPGVAYDLMPMDRYRAHNWQGLGGIDRVPYASLYTSLGCPYRCTFCCIQAPFKSGEQVLGFKETINTYRMWDPEIVVRQIDTLVTEYGVQNIKIADEMFVLNPKHVNDLCDLLIARNYDLNIWAYARVDTVREGMADKLKKAGVNWLAFGVESASERVRKDVDKDFGQELIFRTLEQVRAAGIYSVANYIFGLPEDNLQTMQETLDLALELNTEWANIYCAMAYPGSELYDQALRDGWPLPTTWAGYSQHAVDTVPVPSKHLSGKEVLEFRDAAFHTYFENPRYLEMIAGTFGQPSVQHIQEMTSIRLERNTA